MNFRYFSIILIFMFCFLENASITEPTKYDGWESFDNLSIEQQAFFFNSLDVDNKTKLLQDILIHYKIVQPPDTNIKFYPNGTTFVNELYKSKIMEMPTWEIINNKIYIYKNNKKAYFPDYDTEIWSDFQAEVAINNSSKWKFFMIHYTINNSDNISGNFFIEKKWDYTFEEKQYQQKLKALNESKSFKADKNVQ